MPSGSAPAALDLSGDPIGETVLTPPLGVFRRLGGWNLHWNGGLFIHGNSPVARFLFKSCPEFIQRGNNNHKLLFSYFPFVRRSIATESVCTPPPRLNSVTDRTMKRPRSGKMHFERKPRRGRAGRSAGKRRRLRMLLDFRSTSASRKRRKKSLQEGDASGHGVPFVKPEKK